MIMKRFPLQQSGTVFKKGAPGHNGRSHRSGHWDAAGFPWRGYFLEWCAHCVVGYHRFRALELPQNNGRAHRPSSVVESEGDICKSPIEGNYASWPAVNVLQLN